jgi:hypothetical protein
MTVLRGLRNGESMAKVYVESRAFPDVCKALRSVVMHPVNLSEVCSTVYQGR